MEHLKLRDNKGRLISYLTDEERKERKKNSSKYNSEKTKLYNAKYKDRVKEWTEKNKEVLKEKKRLYYQNKKQNFQEYNKKYYIENKEKLDNINKEWALKNKNKRKEHLIKHLSKPETKHKRLIYGKKYRQLDCVKVSIRNRSKKRGQIEREELHDNYVLSRIVENCNITREQIKQHPEIIEVQKLIIKTKRLCKTSQN
jgi:hypothetical protein